MGDSECSLFVRKMQEKNVSPMPIIGLYVAAASLLCYIAMAGNCLGKLFYFKKCLVSSRKIFTLNATSLTLLAVATKLTGDLTTSMWSYLDNLVKVTSTIFLTIAMGSFFSTMGLMNGNDIVSNVTALSILVITVLVNLCIQLSTGALDYSLFPEIIVAMVLLFLMFVTFVSSALAVPAIKKSAESKYQTIRKKLELEGQKHRVEELRSIIRKYSVMAATGSPQFLVTSSVGYVFVGNICLLSAATLESAFLRSTIAFNDFGIQCHKMSDYKWSVILIAVPQIFAIVPAMYDVLNSLFVMVCKYEENGIKIIRQGFAVESYWTDKLEDWRHSSIPARIKRHMVRKFLYNIKGLILTFCIGVQTVVVVCCKFSCVVFFYIMLPLVHLFYSCAKEILEVDVSNDESGPEIDYNCYVILLEGEKQLPQRFLRNIINWVDEHIKEGQKQQPNELLDLLNTSFSFRGIIEFDSDRVPSLLADEPPNCWTLPVVTLTSIAIALPNVASQHIDWLIRSLDKGIHYASLVDVMDETYRLKNIENAADLVWTRLQLHKKWLDLDLADGKSGEVKSAKEIIKALANEAERIVLEFKVKGDKNLVENPLYWPANVLAANSMYRISRTILLFYENGECQAGELFRKLICIIADILAACLTNLPHLIATKCRCNAIEKRDKSVCDAAILFGETEHILKHFEERQLSSNGPTQPLCIDEWRQWMETRAPTVSAASGTSSRTSLSSESNEIVVVQVQA